MNKPAPPVLDMTADGRFRSPPARPAWSLRLLVAAVVVSILAFMLSLAALALWFAAMLLPFALAAGLVAWATLRFRIWQQRRRGSLRGSFVVRS